MILIIRFFRKYVYNIHKKNIVIWITNKSENYCDDPYSMFGPKEIIRKDKYDNENDFLLFGFIIKNIKEN